MSYNGKSIGEVRA